MNLKNGSKLVVRKADKKDAQKLIDFLVVVRSESNYLLGTPNDPIPTLEQEEKFIERFKDSTTAAFFVGFIDDDLICAGEVSGKRQEKASHHGGIAMSVLKEYWGIGVGSALLEQMIDFAKNTAKLEILHLGVHADNARGINLYKRAGFKEIGRFPKFFKIDGAYYDEILMNLYF
ncbi:MAG: GNAT family N-acetyltransferase [Defluviitaleaceae bacterium]|nr:GNAT family N-acetyltransferase [Defluviitaleaceae bacterium]